MSRKVVIEFLGDSKDLQNAMGDADSKGSKLSGSLKKVGKAAALGLGAGLAVGAVALVKMTQGAIEDEAAQKKLEGALKNATGATDKQVDSVEEWISAQGKAYGVTDDDLRPALARLATATGSVSKAQKLASLAMDISAGTGKSLEQVTTALAKAQNGSVAGLTRLGIKTKDSTKDAAAMQAANIALTAAQDDYNEAVKTYGAGSKEAKAAAAALEYRQTKLGEAQGKVKNTTIDFTEAQKRLTQAYGGQASDAAQTLEGKMARLKLILAETGETIGSKLIPMITVAADWFLNKGLPAAQAFGGWLGDTFPPIFEKIRTVVSSVMGAVQGDVGGGLGAVQQIFTDVTTIVMSLWNTFGATILDYAKSSFENVKQVIGGALTIVQGIFQTFSSLLQGDWSGAWEGIKKILSGAWEVIKGVVKQAMNVVGTLIDVGWTAAKGIVSGAWDGIKTLVSNGIGKVVDFLTGIPGKFTSALSSLKSTAGELFRDAMDAGKDKVVSIGQTIVGWVAGIPGKLKEKLGDFKEAGAALIGGVVDGMKNAAGIIGGIAGNVWDAVKSMLNGAIDKINAALEFTIKLPGPDITINPTNIPHLAKGGIVNSPTLALIGEDGPEAVVPLSKKNAPRGTMPAMGGGGGGTTIVQLLLPSGQIFEEILIQHNRDTGRPLQVRTLGPA